ncbi:MAG: aspartyl protease family protein [Candidatus Eremiobacteraeota bacterium]|nr:aspartyl protease family protein [Candidatus Eremiobacteraeota bacterium]
MHAALYGQSAVNRTSVHLHGALVILGITGTADIYAIPSRRAFIEIDKAGPVSGSEGFTGTTAWSSDQYGIVRQERFPSERARMISLAYRAALASTGWPVAAQFAGERPLNGSRVDVLRITPQGGAQFELWVDAKTGLPARLVQPLSSGAATTDFSDYRSFKGVKIATAQHTTVGGNTADFRLSSVSFNDAGAAAALLVPPTTAQDYTLNGAPSVTVPFDLVENHVYVRAKLDGKGPYTFIFDTGGANIITPQVAADLKSAEQGNARIGGIGATREQTSFTRVKSLDLNGAELRDQDFIVLDIARSFGIATGLHVDGLIGHEVLARFVTTFDYANRRIIFTLRGNGDPVLSNPLDFAFDGDTPTIHASVDGINGWFTVDTGARGSLSLVTPFVAAHPAIAPTANAPTGTLGIGVGGGATARFGRIRDLRIGAFSIPNVVTSFSTTNTGAFSSSSISGNIGGAVWKRFAITFDYPDQRIGLQPNAAFSLPDTYDRSGLFLINAGGDLTVYDVLTHTPAASQDIRKGDIIASIDGATRSLSQAREMLQGPAGQHVTLSVKRGADQHNVNLVLSDYL